MDDEKPAKGDFNSRDMKLKSPTPERKFWDDPKFVASFRWPPRHARLELGRLKKVSEGRLEEGLPFQLTLAIINGRMKQSLLYLATVAGFILPFFNIPFILKIRQNKSSKDISLTWALGVWICAILMLPQAVLSPDFSFKIFGIVNVILFTCAFFHIIYYRKGV